MLAEENKATARRFFQEVWNERNLQVVDEIFADPVLLNGSPTTCDDIRRMVRGRLDAFPDLRVTVEEQIAEGDKVVTRRSWTGTHEGPLRGVAATGKRAEWSQISVVRFVDGKIVEDWVVADEWVSSSK